MKDKVIFGIEASLWSLSLIQLYRYRNSITVLAQRPANPALSVVGIVVCFGTFVIIQGRWMRRLKPS